MGKKSSAPSRQYTDEFKAEAVKRPVSDLGAENSRERTELANAKMDLEIVKKRGHISPVGAQLRPVRYA